MNIQFEQICFSYNHAPVLEDINCCIDKGNFIGILGPNGAGKTTLLKIIEKLLKPNKGLITINERNLNTIKQSEMSKLVGYIPQNQEESFPMTVFNTILMGRKPHFSWGPNNEDYDIVSQIIEDLNLSDLSLRNIDEMSGGQKQKVLIGRILAQNPDLLLLDEPTANLDLQHQLELLELLKNLSKKGKTIIMAIHDINLALKFCNRFMMIREHSIYNIGGHEIITSQSIEDVFNVEASIVKDGRGNPFIIPEKPI